MTQPEQKSSDHKLARERIIALVFGLLGVVQGLAFTKLAERFPTTFRTFEFSIPVLSSMIYFLVGFAIVARVFQTFACGIVAYTKIRTDVWGLYGMFFAGVCEYALFGVFAEDGTVDSFGLFLRVALLAVVALLFHFGVIVQSKISDGEKKIQLYNLYSASSILVCCLIAMWVRVDLVSTLIALVICIILFVNTNKSIQTTDFGYVPPNDR